jgi:hypothetical protein
MLVVDVLNPQANFSFSLCMKQNVAMPATSNIANWPGQCAVYNFAQPTTVAAAKRAVYSSGALRGVGSEASAHGASASAAVAYNNHGLLERRALVGNWSASAMVRVGNYFATLIATTAPTVNTTITLQLSGKQCAGGGYGPACEVPAELGNNDMMVVHTPVTASTLLTFDGSFINGSTQALDLTLAKSGNATGTAYVRWSAPPLTVAGGYDLMLVLGEGTTSASVPSPRSGLWFVMLVDTDNVTVLTLNVTLNAPYCAAGSVGAKCDTQFTSVGSTAGAVSDLGTLASGGQAFVAFAAKTPLSIAAAADDSPSVPSLYAKLGGLPTATDYDFANCNVAACSNQVTLKVPSTDVPAGLQDEQWYALVVANGDGGVSVWNADACANNCSGDNGSCTVATSTCACNDDFEGFDCSTSKSALERWEWALIIGGGVLVAIALIGCIVYFIQKQNRRKGFERV